MARKPRLTDWTEEEAAAERDLRELLARQEAKKRERTAKRRALIVELVELAEADKLPPDVLLGGLMELVKRAGSEMQRDIFRRAQAAAFPDRQPSRRPAPSRPEPVAAAGEARQPEASAA